MKEKRKEEKKNQDPFSFSSHRMDSLPLEIFCEIATRLSSYDLFRLGLVNRSHRDLSRSQVVWVSHLKSKQRSDSSPEDDFYEGCLELGVEVVAVSGLMVGPQILSALGRRLVSYAERDRKPLILRLIQKISGIPPLFLVQDPASWPDVFSCEEIYEKPTSGYNPQDSLNLLKDCNRVAEPGDDLVFFLMLNGRYWGGLEIMFKASPNFRGKNGFTPLFLKKEINFLLEIGSDPSLCDVMGRNAVFAAVSEIWQVGDDPREEPADMLGEYMRGLGRERLCELLMANGSGLTAFQQAKLQGNLKTLEFLSENYPKETEVIHTSMRKKEGL